MMMIIVVVVITKIVQSADIASRYDVFFLLLDRGFGILLEFGTQNVTD